MTKLRLTNKMQIKKKFFLSSLNNLSLLSFIYFCICNFIIYFIMIP